MTSSTPFGRRGLQPAAAWPRAASAAPEEAFSRASRQEALASLSSAASAVGRGSAREAGDGAGGVFSLLFSFSGRIRRSQYWIANIALNVVILTCLGVILAQAGLHGLLAAQKSGLLLPIFLPTTWISYALLVKRFHDRDRSWPWVFMVWVPILGPLWVLIDCGFLEGTPGPNRFGPSPKGIGGVDLADFD